MTSLGTKLLCGLISAACSFPAASQSPSGDAAPKSIFGLYAPTGKAVRDNIRVKPGDKGKVAFALKLYYVNGHTCTLNKEGEWLGDHLLIVADGLNENEPCKLEALFPQGRIVLKDEGQRCAQVYCGTRGKLDAVSFPKRSSAPK